MYIYNVAFRPAGCVRGTRTTRRQTVIVIVIVVIIIVGDDDDEHNTHGHLAGGSGSIPVCGLRGPGSGFTRSHIVCAGDNCSQPAYWP